MNEFFDILLVAQVCHAANNAWENFFGKERPNWLDLPPEKREGYCSMVGMFSRNATCREVHEEFLRSRRDNGWKLGDRNDRTKTDPFLLPYDQLCGKMQLRYDLFKNIVDAFRKG